VAVRNKPSRLIKVGIHIRYQRCEAAWIALQLASWLKNNYIDCSVLSFGKEGQNVYPQWDSRIRTDRKLHNLSSWFAEHTHIVWIGDVSKQDVKTAKQAGAKTVFIVSWDDSYNVRSLYESFDYLITMSPSLRQRLVAEYKNKKIFYIPLHMIDLAQRQSSHTYRPDKPRVLLNLRNSRSHQLGSKLTPVLKSLFAKHAAEWTLWVPKSLINKKSWISKAIIQNQDSSYKLEFSADWDNQRWLYGSHDLMIWPTLYIGYGLSAIMAQTMGLPVVGFDVPILNEYLVKENSHLIPVQIQYNKSGIASMSPDLARLESVVSKILAAPQLITKFKKHTGDWSKERYELYESGWKQVLNDK
jgi:glycosyltransferase involved in cell wall biosynthesis